MGRGKWGVIACLLWRFLSFFHFWLRWVSVAARRLSLVAMSGAPLHCDVRTSRGVASLAVEHGLQAHGLQRAGSAVVAPGLSCSAACGIIWGQGFTSVPCVARRFLTTGPLGKAKGSLLKGKWDSVLQDENVVEVVVQLLTCVRVYQIIHLKLVTCTACNL